jgi:hypothetical protein
MDIDKLNMAIMNIPSVPDESKYPKYSAEYHAYKIGHRDARHAAVEILLEHFKDDAEPSVAADERALFETWASGGSHVTLSHVFSFTPHPNQSRYLDGTTELCWRAWQARAALASPAVSQMDGAVEKVSCPACNGTGGVMTAGDCSDCNGKGYDWEPVEPAATTTSTDRFLDNWEDGESWGGAHAATTASASDFNICYEAGVRCQCKDGEEICLRNRRAQAPSRENAKAVQVFTCIGKGGEYEVIGYSNGAGPKRGESIVVYYDVTKPDILYHRSADDFKVRMQWQGTRASHAANAGEADVQPGVEFAAKFIEKRAEDYARENSSMEHDTGATVWHYGTAGFDYHCTLIELAEDLRAAIASSAAQEGK